MVSKSLAKLFLIDGLLRAVDDFLPPAIVPPLLVGKNHEEWVIITRSAGKYDGEWRVRLLRKSEAFWHSDWRRVLLR
jgi:hypothetical protein